MYLLLYPFLSKLLELLDPVDKYVDDDHEDSVGRLVHEVVVTEELVYDPPPREVLGPGVLLSVDVGEELLTQFPVALNKELDLDLEPALIQTYLDRDISSVLKTNIVPL